MPDAWGIAVIIAKWALYVGVLGATGTVLCALMFKLAKYRAVAAGFAILGLAGAVVSFQLKGVALTGDASGMMDRVMLELLWGTQSGTSLRLQAIGMLLLLIGLGLGRAGLVLSAIAGLTALYSFTVSGHISDRNNWLLPVVLLLHLAFASFWIGVLIPLRRLALDQSTLSDAAALGERFGRRAMAAVPLLIVAGGILTYVLVGSLTAMVSTEYGQALLVKTALVGLLLALAAANKLRFVPGLKAGDAASAGHLGWTIILEWIAILLILCVTAILTTNLTLPT